MSDKLQAWSQLSMTFNHFHIFFRYDKGGHLFLPSYVMRTHGSRKQVDTMRNIPGRQMQKVFEVLNYGTSFWFFNMFILQSIKWYLRLIWCVYRPSICLEAPNGGLIKRFLTWWRASGLEVATLQAWLIVKMWGLIYLFHNNTFHLFITISSI